MFCRFCGATLAEKSAYCHSCGKSLAAPTTSATSASTSPAPGDSKPTQAQPKKGNQSTILIGVAATVAFIVLVIAVLWLRSSRNNPEISSGQEGKAALKAKEKPSFDCTKAKTATETEICADGELASLEVSMVAAYHTALDQLPLAERADFRRQHLEWFKKYQESCNAQAGTGQIKQCISKALSDRTRDLQASKVASDALPTGVGQCTTTTVSKTGTRLSEGLNGPDVPGSGSLISYADGGSQVSYDTIPGIEHSRIGDKVYLCLVSIPTSCPPGDDRGKVYSAKNLRTGATWRLPDSQHSCGGA